MDLSRYIEECAACGLKFKGLENGIPWYAPPPAGNDALIAVQLLAKHKADLEEYLALDLETWAADLKALVTQDQWDAYVAIQTAANKKKIIGMILEAGGALQVWAESLLNGDNPTVANLAFTTRLNEQIGE